MEINLPYQYQPREYQIPLLRAIDNGVNRAVVLWHRRSGKDKTLVNLVAKKMMERLGTYYYFFPTYRQGKKILWNGMDKTGFKFMNHLPPELRARTDKTEMLVEFKNGSIFQIVGTDDYDSIVGTNPIGCVFSEYALQNPNVWDFIRPILKENGGWAIFNYTPRGKNHGYDLYEMATNNPKWFVQKLTVNDTGILTEEDIQEERDSGMSEEMIQQEYYCSFTAAIMGAYYAKEYDEAEKAGRFTNIPYEPASLVHTVWDLGIRDSMAIGFYQAVGLERRKIDYMELTGKGLPEAIKLVKEKPYTYGKHFAPHDIQVRELGTGKSRLEVAKELGINFEIVPNISIQDGIDAGRRFFKKLWVDKTNCKDWLKLIPQYTKEYDEDKKIFKDKPLHDWTSHGADEHRYASLVEDKMDNGTKQPTYTQPAWEPETSYFTP
jgi:phage terminase large subunit